MGDTEDGIERSRELMASLGIDGRIIRHERSGKTTPDAHEALDVPKERILKTLLFALGDDRAGVIVGGTDEVSTEKLAEAAGSGGWSLASPEEVERRTGFPIGGVPPFAFHDLCPAFVDERLLDLDWVVGAAGTPHAGVRFDPQTLVEIGYQRRDVATGDV